MRTLGRMMLLLGLVLGASRPVHSQSAPDIEIARGQIERLVVDSAIPKLRALVAQPQQWSPSHLTRAHTLLGIAFVMQGQLQAAQEAFHEAIWLDPTLQLDSLLYLSTNLQPLFRGEQARWTAWLRVETNPSDAPVWLGSRLIGSTPFERPVPAQLELALDIRGPGGLRSVTLTVPNNRKAVVEAALPMDTLPWPARPDPAVFRQMATSLSTTQWKPSRPIPIPVPQKPKAPHAWTLLGAGLGLVGGVLLANSKNCTAPCDPNYEVDSGTAWLARGLVGTLGALIGAGGGAIIDGGRRKSARKRYQEYTAQVAAFDRERATWIDQQALRRAVEADSANQRERQRVMGINAQTHMRNAELPAPKIDIQRIPER